VQLVHQLYFRLGDWVISIGHPLGLQHSVSTGIISALERRNRDIDMAGKMDPRMEFIQTNLPGVDHGSSGGAVFNLNGEMIAIDTIRASTGGIK
jgi:serine protease Do